MPKNKPKVQGLQCWQGGYSHVYRKRRSKTDWSGVGIGDAFKNNLDYYLRMPAQKNFYKSVKKAQMTVARMMGEALNPDFQPRCKPQLGPYYTTYPATLAAHASIGLTAFLEFEAMAGGKILFSHLQEYLNNPAEADNSNVHSGIYKKIAETVTDCVQTRLLLECLSRHQSLSSVELYRLFSASQQHMKFDAMTEIIRTGILYGDVMPNWSGTDLHPLTRSILSTLADSSEPYFEKIATTGESDLLKVGVKWVRDICIKLIKYLPPKEESPRKTKSFFGVNDRLKNNPRNAPESVLPEEPFSHIDTDLLSPLNGPNHPMVFEPESAAGHTLQALVNKAMEIDGHDARRGKDQKLNEQAESIMNNFAEAMEKAGGQESKWEDLRSDLVERSLRTNAFEQSPIQGNPAEGHEISLQMDNDQTVAGEVFDIPVELSDSLEEYENLINDSQPITDCLRRNLYPNVQQVAVTQRLRASGTIDPARLAMADFSPVIFKRYRPMQQADKRGHPVLVIACDGSGSLNERQMRMLKMLAAGWLNSTTRSEIKVLACLYHSGSIREGVTGPLIQWIYHPHKTQTLSRRESIRALVTLPDEGTGVQSDALSIAYIMEEARRFAKSDMIYLILLSDTQWNRSFNTRKNGQEEVYTYFEQAYRESSSKLHTTLVALGVQEETGFEDLLDRVITVSDEDLDDYSAVAGKIGDYVSSCMKERYKVMGMK